MKTLFTLAFAIASVAVFAQNVDVPAKEFSVNLSENSVSVKPGESKQVTITLVRSKSFSKEKAKVGVSNSLPQGVTIQFDQTEGIIESSVATIGVGAGVVPGTYQIILSGTMNHKTKGSILKIVVGNENVAAK